jgi:hypothetical protein
VKLKLTQPRALPQVEIAAARVAGRAWRARALQQQAREAARRLVLRRRVALTRRVGCRRDRSRSRSSSSGYGGYKPRSRKTTAPGARRR